MFWLFKRKKVADRRAITPCVCDNGNQAADTYTLQDFGSGPSESTPPKMTVSTQDRTRKGYHRLEVPPEEEQRPEDPPPVPPPVEEMTSSSTESSEDYEREYFGGFTDTDDEEEELTCNVCERSFRTVRRLEQHQQRQRHYGCCICDALFPGLMALELHKETLDHWSDYELRVRELQEVSEDDESEDEPEEHRVYSSKRRDELKRLLL